MNKTTILIIIVGIVLGVAISYFTNWNPISTIQNFIANPQQTLQSIPQVIQQHWQTIAAGLTGFTATLGIANRAYMQTKQKAQQTQELLNSQISELQTSHTTEVEKLQAEIQTLKKQDPSFEPLQEAQKLVSQQQQIISNKDATITELHRVIENLKQKTVVVERVK